MVKASVAEVLPPLKGRRWRNHEKSIGNMLKYINELYWELGNFQESLALRFPKSRGVSPIHPSFETILVLQPYVFWGPHI